MSAQNRQTEDAAATLTALVSLNFKQASPGDPATTNNSSKPAIKRAGS
eukprot:g43068.t1